MKSDFQPFELERMMSRLEQTVDYNLSESGVHPMLLQELIDFDPPILQHLLQLPINYPHVNGTPELRQQIANMYEGATTDHILVTVGAIEANYIAIRSLLAPGDEIVVMLPNYMQIWGIAKNHQLRLKTFPLREEHGWAPDIDQLRSALCSKTRLIAVCNPNNPTGRCLTQTEMQEIVDAARNVGAWILADEVYRGAERIAAEPTPSFFGMYEKTLAIGSMSKAYGLPGLRIGWVVAPPETIDQIWARHEYINISATMLSNHLAALALSPSVRNRIRQRTRNYINQGFPILRDWMNAHPNMFSLVEPQAAAIAFVRYHLPVNSSDLCDRLVQEQNVLVVPGDQFGLDQFLRISFGLDPEYLTTALDRIHQTLVQYR